MSRRQFNLFSSLPFIRTHHGRHVLPLRLFGRRYHHSRYFGYVDLFHHRSMRATFPKRQQRFNSQRLLRSGYQRIFLFRLFHDELFRRAKLVRSSMVHRRSICLRIRWHCRAILLHHVLDPSLLHRCVSHEAVLQEETMGSRVYYDSVDYPRPSLPAIRPTRSTGRYQSASRSTDAILK